jgi:D-3-phosphoglycerate dehydrogenase / 2-oxoglutarate reductase
MASNMHKVLVVEPFHEEGMRLLRARPDLELEVIDSPQEALIAARIADAEAITLRAGRLGAGLIARAPRLRVVCRHGVGYDNVDLEALSARGIPLTITADANAVPVAEHAFYLMLALANQGPLCDRETRRGEWAGLRRTLQRFELEGKRLLIIGFGRIGREVAVRAEAFGMEVVVYDPYVEDETIGRSGYGHVGDYRAALPEVDVLSVHAPLTRETRGMIGEAELAALPRHAIVINTARGGIIDEAALVDALRAGRIAGAGLDVFEEEPPPRDHPLFALANVVLTPHAAGVSRESAVRMAVSVARSVIEGLDGRLDPLVVVNREVL